MRYQLVFLPALVAAAPVMADDFLTVAEAQSLIFPNATLTPADFVLTDKQLAALKSEARVPVLRRQVKAWKVSTGGWFFLDQVIGRDDRVTYAIGIDSNGAVKDVEVLTCLAQYDGIRRLDWLAQFKGLRYGRIDVLDQVSVIAGSTLSTTHLTEGVKRMLATYNMFLAPKAAAAG